MLSGAQCLFRAIAATVCGRLFRPFTFRPDVSGRFSTATDTE
jgi:hypothetical protein